MRSLALALLLAGCAEMTLAARDRFEAEFRCDRSRVQVEELGGNAYRATGCGRTVTYTCEAASGMAAIQDPAVCRRER